MVPLGQLASKLPLEVCGGDAVAAFPPSFFFPLCCPAHASSSPASLKPSSNCDPCNLRAASAFRGPVWFSHECYVWETFWFYFFIPLGVDAVFWELIRIRYFPGKIWRISVWKGRWHNNKTEPSTLPVRNLNLILFQFKQQRRKTLFHIIVVKTLVLNNCPSYFLLLYAEWPLLSLALILDVDEQLRINKLLQRKPTSC